MLYAGYNIKDMGSDFDIWLKSSSFIERLTLYLCVAYAFGVVLICFI